MKPELFDIVELLVNLPEFQQSIGTQGTIVECHDLNHFEVEFSNEAGETTALCVLSPQQFVVVWQAQSKLYTVLNPEQSPQLDLATAIDRRFAELGEFELPETPRDAMRTAPNFNAE
jgi:Domain of unknown function (DUF4926)